MGSNLAELFAPGVAEYVESLLVEGRVGICSGTLRIIDIGSRFVNDSLTYLDSSH